MHTFYSWRHICISKDFVKRILILILILTIFFFWEIDLTILTILLLLINVIISLNKFYQLWTNFYLKENIKKWNHEDVQLYKHFNRTFWKRIRTNEDPMFWNDVKELQEMNTKLNTQCFSHGKKYFIPWNFRGLVV